MTQRIRYEFQQRSDGRGAVVRWGPLGGSKTVTVYDDQAVAMQVVKTLNTFAPRESR